jgi:hypothetical protein
MLDQRLSTIPQHQWISKLFGFDFTVEYRLGRLNMVADALSRREGEALSLETISLPSFDIFDELWRELDASEDLRSRRDAAAAGVHGPQWSVRDGLLLHDGHVFVPALSSLLPDVLQLAHTVGHEGVQKMLQRLRTEFFVEHDRRVVRDYVRACATCQRNKTEALHPAGLL